MTLRQYLTHVPWQDGRLPLLPARAGARRTTRWLVPTERPEWFWYCEADRLDIFPIPDHTSALCLPHQLAPYDPDYREPLLHWPRHSWQYRRWAQARDAKHEALEDAALVRLQHWVAEGRFPLADDGEDDDEAQTY